MKVLLTWIFLVTGKNIRFLINTHVHSVNITAWFVTLALQCSAHLVSDSWRSQIFLAFKLSLVSIRFNCHSGSRSQSNTDSCTYLGNVYHQGNVWVDGTSCDICECNQYGVQCRAGMESEICVFSSKFLGEWLLNTSYLAIKYCLGLFLLEALFLLTSDALRSVVSV